MEKKKIKGMFVNLLMKHGKKSRALYLLEASVYLFIQNLLKINIKTISPSSSIKAKHHNILQSSSHVKSSIRIYKEQTGNSFFGRSLSMLSNKGGSAVDKRSNEQSMVYPTFSDRSLPGIFSKKYTSDIPEKKCVDVSCTAHEQLIRVEKTSNTADLRHTFPFLLNFSSIFLNFYAYQRFYEKKENRVIHSATVKKFFLDFHIVLQNQDHAGWALHNSSKNPLALAVYKVFTQQSIEKGVCFSLKKDAPKFDADNGSTKVPKNSWYRSSGSTFCWERYTEAQKNTHLHYLYAAISNVKPPLECKSKRFGGSNRQIPATVSENRQWGTAITWIIEAALYQKKKKKGGALQSMIARRSEHGLGIPIVQNHTRFSRGQKLGKDTLNTLSAFRQQARNRKPHEYIGKPTETRQHLRFSQEKEILQKDNIFVEKDFSYPDYRSTKKKPIDTKNSANIHFLEKYTHMLELQNVTCMSKKEVDNGTVNITPYSSTNAPERKGFAVSAPKQHQSAMLGGASVVSLQNAQSKNTLPLFCHFLAEALQNAYYKRGSAVEKRDLWVDTAVTNRAYLRDRWW